MSKMTGAERTSRKAQKPEAYGKVAEVIQFPTQYHTNSTTAKIRNAMQPCSLSFFVLVFVEG